eukprot:scaffold566_cov364-Pavlova_lutheri.AAC.29
MAAKVASRAGRGLHPEEWAPASRSVLFRSGLGATPRRGPSHEICKGASNLSRQGPAWPQESGS